MRVTFSPPFYRADQVQSADIPGLSRAKWRHIKKLDQWVTTDVSRAAPFAAFAVGEAARRLNDFNTVRDAQIADSIAVTADIDVPTPPGRALRPYQKAAVKFAMDRRHVLIADGMRLGKTLEGIGVANMLPRLKSVLVICPATAKLHWNDKLTEWLTHPLKVGYADGDSNPKTPALVINYDILKRHIDYLRSIDWDLIICDESHRLKNPKATRTKLTLGFKSKRADQRVPPLTGRKWVFLSGTQMYTRPLDLWPVCEKCDPEGLGANWWHFVHRYCNAFQGTFGLDTTGASNLEELQFKMRSSFMIRRTKHDIGTVIEPVEEIIKLPVSGLEKIIERERAEALAHFPDLVTLLNEARVSENPALLDTITAAYGDRPTTPVAGNDPDELSSYIETHAALATTRRQLALAKCNMAVDFITDLLESEQKVVVFGHHRDVVTKIHEAFPGAVKLLGGMSARAKQNAVDRFNDDPECRVFVGNLLAAGEAISLRAADAAVFVEMSWLPSEMNQAKERIWDATKTDSVLGYYYLVVQGSLDEAMATILRQRSMDDFKAMSKEALTSVPGRFRSVLSF